MNLNEKIGTNNTQIGKHFIILIALERFYGDGGGKNVACGMFLSLEQQMSKLTVSQRQDMHVKHIALFTFHSNLMT